ncbi:MAG: SAF domain-containing protein [Erysipelotrichaceae bacterium]|nr:SAF domain-containing protein [Erysipelotrichaceae bacterium]
MQNKLFKIFLSLIVVLAAGCAIYLESTAEVPVLNKEVAVGDVIKPGDISMTRMAKSSIPDGIVHNAIELVGKEAVYKLPADTVIPENSIIEKVSKENVIPSDEVIVSIETQYQRVPSDLKENDEINIIAYFDAGKVQDAPAFLIGINENATVKFVRKDDTGHIGGIDVSIRKDVAPKIAASNAMGQIYIVKNITDNNINLNATTLRDIYDEAFSIGTVYEVPSGNEVNE